MYKKGVGTQSGMNKTGEKVHCHTLYCVEYDVYVSCKHFHGRMCSVVDTGSFYKGDAGTSS